MSKKEKTRSKKEKKEKKKKHQKEKSRRRSADHFNDKTHRSSQVTSSEPLNEPKLQLDDMHEIALFKEAVQGKTQQKSSVTSSFSSDLLNVPQNKLVESLGLSKGLIRTSESQLSITEKYSNDIFGDGEMNPAKRQRLHREQAAQRALDKARSVIASRQESGYHDSGVNYANNMLDRFSTTKKS